MTSVTKHLFKIDCVALMWQRKKELLREVDLMMFYYYVSQRIFLNIRLYTTYRRHLNDHIHVTV